MILYLCDSGSLVLEEVTSDNDLKSDNIKKKPCGKKRAKLIIEKRYFLWKTQARDI